MPFIFAVVAKHPRIHLAVADGELLVEGLHVQGRSPFIKILTDKPAVLGFADLISEHNLEHVQSERVRIELITES